MMTPDRMLDVLKQYPFPGASDVRAVVLGCYMIIDGQMLVYSDDGWLTGDREIPAEWPTFDSPDDGDRVHAEIRRVLAVLAETSPPTSAIQADCVGPELPTPAPLRAATKEELFEMGLGDVSAERYDALQDRLTDEIDRRRDVEAQLAKITDAHAVVSQRLIGAQKEVAERDVTIESKESKIIDLTLRLGQTQNRVGDLESELAGVRRDAAAIRRERDRYATDLTGEREKVKRLTSQHDDWQADVDRTRQDADAANARADAAEAKVKRLLRQRAAAHAVLDEAAIGLEKEGAHRWTLARRCRAAVAQVWEGVEEAGRADLLRLLDYHQAPVKFNDRPLTTAERAAFVIRRLWQGRANAASEASALRRELSEITDALAHLPDCAERSPIGQVTEYLNLNAAERIRFAFPKGASDV